MAEVRKIGSLTVNDGKGLLDNDGLIDSLIVDCNTVVKRLASGEYIAFCALISEMAQKLVTLKAGIKNEAESKDAIIAELKKDGASNGAE